MSEKAKPRRDAFTFSLGGVKTISSFTIAPVIADDRINKALHERQRHNHGDQPDITRPSGLTWGRLWLRRRHQVA